MEQQVFKFSYKGTLSEGEGSVQLTSSLKQLILWKVKKTLLKVGELDLLVLVRQLYWAREY